LVLGFLAAPGRSSYQSCNNDGQNNLVDTKAARAMEFSRAVSSQETTALYSMQLPPDPQPSSSLPLNYFPDGVLHQTSSFTLYDMCDIGDSTILSNYELDEMEWTNIFGELSVAGHTNN